MKKKTLVVALTLAVSASLAYAESTAPVAEPATAVHTGVRKPVGDVNKFWDAIPWEDLSPEEQQLWSALSDGASWDKMSEEARAAATALGFNRKAWNSVPAK